MFFLEETNDELLHSKVLEGASMVLLSIDKAISGEGFVEGSTRFLKEVKDALTNN